MIHYPLTYLLQKLGYSGRPKEVGEWIKTRNFSNVPTLDLKCFVAAWWKWWEGLQPAWRVVQTRTTPDDYVAADDWPKLRKAGNNGIFTVILALSWWMENIKKGDGASKFFEARDDVSWVLDQLNVDRPSLKSGGRSSRKRYVNVYLRQTTVLDTIFL